MDKGIDNLIKILPTKTVKFDLKGTNFYVLSRYTESKIWIFELLIKENRLSLTKEGREKYVFINSKIEDANDLEKNINSVCELNVYGNKIPLKDRFFLNGNIDLGINIERLQDKHQGITSWFYVDIKTPRTFIRTQIEVPKEAVAASMVSELDRQKVLNEARFRAADLYYENVNYGLEKRKYYEDILIEKKNMDLQHRIESTNAIFGMIGGGIGLVGSLAGAFAGSGGGRALGVLGIASSATSFAQSLSNYWYMGEKQALTNETYETRKEQGIRTFYQRDQQMATKFRQNEIVELQNLKAMSLATSYPQFNNNLIYKPLNKLLGLDDVYLTRYTPKDDILDAIKDHYNEYGFEIYLKDQNCYGISSIRDHLQYQTIKQSYYPNETIKGMIETRLLNGIKVVEWR